VAVARPRSSRRWKLPPLPVTKTQLESARRKRLTFGDLDGDGVEAHFSRPIDINGGCGICGRAEDSRGGAAALGACERHSSARVSRRLAKENLVAEPGSGWKLQTEPGANSGFHS